MFPSSIIITPTWLAGSFISWSAHFAVMCWLHLPVQGPHCSLCSVNAQFKPVSLLCALKKTLTKPYLFLRQWLHLVDHTSADENAMQTSYIKLIFVSQLSTFIICSMDWKGFYETKTEKAFKERNKGMATQTFQAVAPKMTTQTIQHTHCQNK